MKKLVTGAAVFVIAASGASAALAAVPGVISEGTAPPKVKPKQIVYIMGAFFAGPQRVSKTDLGRIHWSKWNKKKAVGSGGNWIDDCKPNCGKGTLHGYPVTLKLSQPKVVAGKDIFTQMVVTYASKVPPHAVKTTTWKVRHSKTQAGTAFFWKYPPNAL
jgi:opacity protein-like surface antigen